MKKVFVVTSTRADWGLLKPVCTRLEKEEAIDLTVVATGTHLKADYGNTIEEIRRHGFEPKYQVDILKFGNDDTAVAKTIAHTIQEFTVLFSYTKPDLLLVLGDRYEMFAVCTAASALGVPIAHISGGDVTVGAKDDFYRHCMSAMANLHFPSCDDSYNRLLRLGQTSKTYRLCLWQSWKKALNLKTLHHSCLSPTTLKHKRVHRKLICRISLTHWMKSTATI